MDIATLVGLLLGFGALLGAMVMEGGSIGSLMSASPFVLVLGGTLGATMICFPMKDVIGLIGAVRHAFFAREHDHTHVIRSMVHFAERARREGLLALEQDVQQLNDPFIQKGLQLAVDGIEPQLVREILETEIEQLSARHAVGEEVLTAMGGFSPTMGIIGTVMGLIHMLDNLSDPGAMGPAIAAAFLATLYGVTFANLVFLPLGNKLKVRSKEEVLGLRLIVEGILSIQSGDNPRVVQEKLIAFLPPRARGAVIARTEGE